jgi:hypothetical protein
MPHAIRATGRAGTLLVGGYTIGAVLGAWGLTPGPAGAWALSATLTRVTVPRGWLVVGRDLAFQAPEFTGPALWRVRSVTVGDGAIRALLEAPALTL